MTENEAWAHVIKAVRRSWYEEIDGHRLLERLVVETDEEIEALELLLNIEIGEERAEDFVEEIRELAAALVYGDSDQDDTETEELEELYLTENKHAIAAIDVREAVKLFLDDIYYPLREELLDTKEREFGTFFSLWQQRLVSNATIRSAMERIGSMGILIQKE